MRILVNIVAHEGYSYNVDVFDPWANQEDALREYGIKPIDRPINDKYDAILLAVAHDKFKKLTSKQIRAYGKDNHVLYDIKYLLKIDEVDGRL